MTRDPPADARIARTASAPGKCILIGEHAVVYGAPCLSFAIDLRTTVTARQETGVSSPDRPAPTRSDRFLKTVQHLVAPDIEIAFDTRSDIPQASGLGSSGALTVAAAAALFALGRRPPQADEVAQTAFRAERTAQGGGSPNDTSVSAAGGAVLLAPEKHKEAGLTHLWTITHDDLVWEVHRADLPPVGLVIGHTGVQSHTGEQVAKVRRFVEGHPDGRKTVEAVSDRVWETLDALRAGDMDGTGRLMDQAQSALDLMGAGHPELDRLIAAVRNDPATVGAKLTGAGGGGSIVVLSRDPDAAAAAIRAAGGTPYVVKTTTEGVRHLDAATTEVGR